MTATDTDLPADLVAQVDRLTPAQRDQLLDLLDADGAPPALDWGEINRRLADLEAGRATLLTPNRSNRTCGRCCGGTG